MSAPQRNHATTPNTSEQMQFAFLSLYLKNAIKKSWDFLKTTSFVIFNYIKRTVLFLYTKVSTLLHTLAQFFKREQPRVHRPATMGVTVKPTSATPTIPKTNATSIIDLTDDKANTASFIDLSNEPDDDDNHNPSKILVQLYKRQPHVVDKELEGIQLKTVGKNQYKLISKVHQHRASPHSKNELLTALETVRDIGSEFAGQLLSQEQLSTAFIDKYFSQFQTADGNIKIIDSGVALLKNFYDKLKNSTKSLPTQLKNANKILWPICSGDHYYLLILEKNKDSTYNIYCLDGFNSASRKTHIQKGKKLLQALFPEKTLKSLVHLTSEIDIPIQNNDVDCGAVICYWGRKYAISKPISTKNKQGTCDYSQFRFDIAETIVAKSTQEIKAKTPKT